MTLTSDGMTGEELAGKLLADVRGDDQQVRAAVRLLGAYRDGYWLRRFVEDAALAAAADHPLVHRSGWHPSVDWDGVGLLLLAAGSPVHKASGGDRAVLEFAASLVGRYAVQLHGVVRALEDGDRQLVLEALGEAAYGEVQRLGQGSFA